MSISLDSVPIEGAPTRCRLRLITDEVLSINTDARHLALQVALLLTLLAALIGLFNAFRMMRLPDPQPSTSVEGMALG